MLGCGMLVELSEGVKELGVHMFDGLFQERELLLPCALHSHQKYRGQRDDYTPLVQWKTALTHFLQADDESQNELAM